MTVAAGYSGGFDKGGHFITPADGRAPWREESTALRHPDWFAFRDPAQLWQRPYVRMQAEQERVRNNSRKGN